MPDGQSAAVGMVLMVVIVNRGQGDRLAQFLAENGATFNMLTFGCGTADAKILTYLGLGETKKDILFSMMLQRYAQILFKRIAASEFNLDKPGHGIGFCLPINTAALNIAGTLNSAAGNGETAMEHPFGHDLIIAVTAQGYADEVMKAARSAGAAGGSILRARGAGAKQAEKFFGVTIQPEKEMLFIVTKTDNRKAIMEAIVLQRGMHTDANTIVFSLPVSDVAGMRFDDPRMCRDTKE